MQKSLQIVSKNWLSTTIMFHSIIIVENMIVEE